MNTGVEFRVRAIADRLRHLPQASGVEVGVATGQMSLRLLETLPGLAMVLVDNWLATEQQPPRYLATADGHAHLSAAQQAEYEATARGMAAEFAGRARILKMESAAAARSLGDELFDLVFLDADHSVKGVLADLEAWWPRVRPGGWLCGHDYAGWVCVGGERRPFGVQEAVDEAARREGWGVVLDEDYTWFIQKAAP